MTVGIYGIFDSLTDECLYVGKSINIEERCARHIRNLKTEKHIRKEFVQWFKEKDKDKECLYWVVLESSELDDEVLNLLEIKWFCSLEPRFYGEVPNNKKKWGASERVRKEHAEKTKNPLSIKREELRLLYESKTVQEISLITDRSERQIYYLLKKFSIPTQKEVEAKKDKSKSCSICGMKFIPSKPKNLSCSRRCAGLLSAKNAPRDPLTKKRTLSQDAQRRMSERMKNQKYALGNKGGKITAHKRWHVGRGIVTPECDYCIGNETRHNF